MTEFSYSVEGIFPTCTIPSSLTHSKTAVAAVVFVCYQTDLFLQKKGVETGREGERFQMAGKGHSMAQESVQRIVYLLASTEMTVAEIAERMACSRSVVLAINRRFQVREYSGLRTRWLKAEQKAAS